MKAFEEKLQWMFVDTERTNAAATSSGDRSLPFVLAIYSIGVSEGFVV
jgi:hypothetical protein